MQRFHNFLRSLLVDLTQISSTTMKKILYALLLGMNATAALAQFPGCPAVDAGPNQTLNCSTPCATLTATPFNAGATTSYSVSSIPHTPPIPYNQLGGTSVSVGIDDTWSPSVSLPFPFCFYGQSYNSCIIGSNGSIKFNTASALGYQSWSFSASLPSATLSSVGDIFGVYHDIDPTVNGTVKYYILGTAPCRILCVVYNNLGHFSCTSLRSTFMMVLYETTNVVDVYVQQKQTCATWNSGNAVIGVQNPAGTQAVTPPGRNTGSWTVNSGSPEAWRFTPAGAPIYTVEWFDGATSLGTGNTVNVCPTAATTYEAVATYTACDGTIVTANDFVTVTPSAAAPTGSEINNAPTSCTGNTGSTEVQGSGGAGGYTYSIDGGPLQGSGVFTGLAQGPHTVTIEDANGCQGSVNININQAAGVTLTVNNSDDPSCNGVQDGVINTSASGGTPNYTFTLNGGTGQATGDFTNLPAGTYTVLVTDQAGCTDSQTITLTNPAAITFTLNNTTPATCVAADGSVIVNAATGGTGAFQYSIDNGLNMQPGTTFNGLTAGTYTVMAEDANGCQASVTGIVTSVNTLVGNLDNQTAVLCNGGSTGTATVSGSGTIAPYFFAIDNGTPQPTGTFTGLSAGVHEVVVADQNGCTDTVAITITQPQPIVVNTSNVASMCLNTSASISASAIGGTGTLDLAWNNGAGMGSPVTVSPANTTTYVVTATDDNACTATGQVVVTVNPLPTINAGNDLTICVGMSATLTGTGGVTYTWDNGVTNGTPFTPAQGTVTYTVTGTDANGCVNTDVVVVTVLPVPVAGVSSNDPLSGYPGLVVNFINDSQLGTQYNIDFDNGDSDASTNVATVFTTTFGSPGTYEVILTASNGVCEDTASLTVVVIPFEPVVIHVPNIFTPNGDQVNDEFFIDVENAVSINVIIINRWGNVMAELTDLTQKWDGDGAAEGTYFVQYTVVGKDGTTTTGQGIVELAK
jgi:gliding motility-associated-like protein